MLELFKYLLNEETTYVIKKRANEEFIPRLSTIILIVIGVLYVLSPVELVPEYIVKPKAVGFVDDLILVIFVAYYTYKDLGGEVSLENGRIQLSRVPTKEDLNRKNSVSNTDRPSNENIHDTGDKHSMHDNITAIESGDCTTVNTNNATVVSNHDATNISSKNEYTGFDSVEYSDEYITDEDDEEIRL